MLGLDLSLYDLTNENINKVNEELYLVTKWNWDYKKALAFQLVCQKSVYSNKKLRIFISCSHPHCFTMGRGLQKSKGKIIDGLIEASTEQLAQLKFPLFKIGRGGGLTFHYPGQWIFYPIINLNAPKYNLSELVNMMLTTSQNIITRDYCIDIQTKKGELMGLWSGDSKFSSLGQEINHFVTMHGIAINFIHDKKMFGALNTANPCGLNSSTYQSIESLSDNEVIQESIPKFNEDFLKVFIL